MPIWKDSSVLITGVTGTLGSALCKRLLSRDDAPARLAGISRKWQDQERLRRELGDDSRLRLFLGDIRDPERLHIAFRDVDYIIHTAALKSVPACAFNPSECLSINATGTQNVLQAAMDCGVKRVMVVSSDKAAYPVTTYGASKAMCEALAVGYNSYSASTPTRFACARYGNVANSSGSVIPLFRSQAEQGYITLTHEKMSRFWFSIEQAVEFVLSCLERMQGGEIFVPHLPSAKVLDIAGLIAPGAEVRTVGLRQGEKLHEVMVVPEESGRTRDQGWAYVVYPAFHSWRQTFPMAGSPVESGWLYSSASALRLGGSDLKNMIGI